MTTEILHKFMLSRNIKCGALRGNLIRRLFLSVFFLSQRCAVSLQTPTTGTIHLGELLSTCVAACQAGCAEIRAVQRRRHAGETLAIDLKDLSDPKSALTEADGASQAAIVNALRLEWGPQLRIVGEEDDDDESEGSTIHDSVTQIPFSRTGNRLRRNLCSNLNFAEEALFEFPLHDVTVFVDPLDGTREFVEERLSNCQSLVGIALSGKAVAGAIGIPFPAGNDLMAEPAIIYGAVNAGYGMILTGEATWSSVSPATLQPVVEQVRTGTLLERPFLGTGDNTSPVMMAMREAVIEQFGASHVIYGGAGNKILAAALGHVDAVVQHKYGGPWDVCAPSAILQAMGGRITDIVGNDIDAYSASSPRHFASLGYLATGRASQFDHDQLITTFQLTQKVQDYLAKVESKSNVDR